MEVTGAHGYNFFSPRARGRGIFGFRVSPLWCIELGPCTYENYGKGTEANIAHWGIQLAYHIPYGINSIDFKCDEDIALLSLCKGGLVDRIRANNWHGIGIILRKLLQFVALPHKILDCRIVNIETARCIVADMVIAMRNDP